MLIQNHQRKHKPHHYLYNINKEIQRFQKVKLLQSILNNVIYGATSTISIQDMGIINIDFFTYDCTDVAEIESIGRGKINLLDSRDKTIEFIIIHLDSIQAWLQSDAFRTQYFNNKHPYPPLLNPKQIDYKNLNRWRLVLGNFAEDNIELDPQYSEMDSTLNFLYEREYSKEAGYADFDKNDKERGGKENSGSSECVRSGRCIGICG